MTRAWIFVGAVVGFSALARGGDIFRIESSRPAHPNISLWRAGADGQNAREIVSELRIGDSSTVWGVAVFGDKIYWTDIGPWKYSGGIVTPPQITVMQMNLDGGGIGRAGWLPPVVAAELLQGSAMDDRGYVYSYLSDVGDGGEAVGRIVRLGGGELREIATTAAFFPRPDIVLDLSHRKIYWAGGSDMDDAGLIQRANLDGTGLETLVGPAELDIADNGVDLCLDVEAGKMYWNNSRRGVIRWADLDGTGVEGLISGIYPRGGMAMDLTGRAVPEWATKVDANALPAPEPGGALVMMLTAGLLCRRRRGIGAAG